MLKASREAATLVKQVLVCHCSM